MREGGEALDIQTNLLIRDGLAMEVFFGDIEGETIKTEELKGLAVPCLYLLDERSTKGYKALLYLDALARQLEYYLVFAGAKLSKDPLVHIKSPLYIPNAELELIKKAFKKGYYRYIGKDKEIFEDFDKILEILQYHNNELIPKYISYVLAEGVINNKPTKNFFAKTAKNKKDVIDAFTVFRNMLEKDKQAVEFFTKKMNASALFSFFNDTLIKENVFDINLEELQSVENFLTHNDNTAKNRIILEKDEGQSFFFSLFSPERPIFKKGTVKAENPYTVADMLLYSESALSNKQHEETLRIIHGVGQIYDNDFFDEKIKDMLFIGEKYDEAYKKLGNTSDKEIPYKSYLQETHEAILEYFATVLTDEVRKDFTALLDAEFLKNEKTSSFITEKENFSFSMAFYIIQNVLEKKIHFLPSAGSNTTLKDVQNKKLTKLFKDLIDILIPEYLNRRREYIQKIYEKVKNETESKESNLKEEAEEVSSKKTKNNIVEQAQETPEKVTITEEKIITDDDEEIQKISKDDIALILDDF